MNIIVIGAGGHARVVIDALLSAGESVIGITNAEPERIGGDILGVPVLGTDDVLREHGTEQTRLVIGVASSGLPTARQTIFEGFKEQGYRFANVIHPGSIIGRDVRLGEGAQIMAGAVIQPFAIIGDNAIVNTRAGVDHDCRIGAHAHIAPGATLSGGITVGAGSLVGCGATVIQGVNIGQCVLVGAGASVCHDIADGARVAGTPAKDLLS